MATLSVNKVLRWLDEDSDSDFDGYIDEEEYMQQKNDMDENDGVLMKLRKSCSHQMTALTLKMVFQNI